MTNDKSVLGLLLVCAMLPLVSLIDVSSQAKAVGPGAVTFSQETPIYSYTVVNTFPHDDKAFTQGLVFTNGVLYEGTGLNGRSSLRKVALETGEVLQSYDLPDEYFGEGITLYDDRIIQLTWKSKIAFVYDRDSFTPAQTFTYTTQGWGLTHDGERLIMSDGSETLYFRHPETFAETGRIDVYDENGPVNRLNELEYIQGEIYANVWHTDRIARIDPATGRVTAWINLAELKPDEITNSEAVLNGIAYDADNDRLFVTGKLWPQLFEIELISDTMTLPTPTPPLPTPSTPTPLPPTITDTLYLPFVIQ